jgi:hypothetical protein
MIDPVAFALGGSAVALLGTTLILGNVRLNRAAFAITVAVFAALAVFATVMLWRVNRWGWPANMPEGPAGAHGSYGPVSSIASEPQYGPLHHPRKAASSAGSLS